MTDADANEALMVVVRGGGEVPVWFLSRRLFGGSRRS